MAELANGRIIALDRLLLEELAQSKLDQAKALQEEAAAFINLLDREDGEADLEDGGDDELSGDETDSAYIEWTTKSGNLRRRGGPELFAGHEDDEDDDPAEDDDTAVDDRPCDDIGMDLEPDDGI